MNDGIGSEELGVAHYLFPHAKHIHKKKKKKPESVFK
jgi:hypothetical protein